MKSIGNALGSLVIIPGSFVFGYGEPEAKPAMPELPPEFKGTELEKSFNDSWKLREQAAEKRIEGFAKLMDFDIGGYWKRASVAAHAEAKDTRVVFPEEGMAQDAAMANARFVDIISHTGSGLGRS